MSFSSFGLNAQILRGVSEAGFTSATSIQQEAIPPALQGRDLLASAATGSGKTAAFLLPIFNRLMSRPRGTTRALVLTPTRELAAQIDQHAAELGRFTGLTHATVIGGVGMGPQIKALTRGVDILIATPGRLLDHMRQRTARLNGVEVLVLDEADRMLDMGFLPDVRRIVQSLSARQQTLFFSATLPTQIVALTRELLKDPFSINLKRQAQPAARVAQSIYPVHQMRKSPLLLKLLRGEAIRNALVFTRTKRRADRVAHYLSQNGVNAARIHGDRTQSQRTQALDGFRRGQYQVLVATDVAARGLDIEALSHVINFDMPGTTEDYIHRVGRTARAQASGDALTFVAPEDEGAWKSIERVLASKPSRVKLPDFDYSVSEIRQAVSVAQGRRFSRHHGDRSCSEAKHRRPFRVTR
jgi:ATP-dependent RNA helicase RhlE